MTIKEKVEEVLRNRILYIGDEVPNFFTKDKRSKSIYLGNPSEMIEEIVKILNKI